jgi:hypothetical protein
MLSACSSAERAAPGSESAPWSAAEEVPMLLEHKVFRYSDTDFEELIS